MAIPEKWGASCILFIFCSNIEIEMVLGVFGVAEHEYAIRFVIGGHHALPDYVKIYQDSDKYIFLIKYRLYTNMA